MKTLKPLKPYMLRRWKISQSPNLHLFFTCARPGRTGASASKNASVPDNTVHRWVLGLPGPNPAIVSLLGRKPDGQSEFSFYSFYGGFDVAADNPGRLSFREWLDRWHGDRSIVLREHPTCDFQPITCAVLGRVAADVEVLLSKGRNVVIVDSGGQTRTGMVCKHMAAVEDSSS